MVVLSRNEAVPVLAPGKWGTAVGPVTPPLPGEPVQALHPRESATGDETLHSEKGERDVGQSRGNCLDDLDR